MLGLKHFLQTYRILFLDVFFNIGPAGKSMLYLARIESVLGIYNIDSIIEAADGIVVGRGELGIAMPPEKLFIIQKMITAKCNKVNYLTSFLVFLYHGLYKPCFIVDCTAINGDVCVISKMSLLIFTF